MKIKQISFLIIGCVAVVILLRFAVARVGIKWHAVVVAKQAFDDGNAEYRHIRFKEFHSQQRIEVHIVKVHRYHAALVDNSAYENAMSVADVTDTDDTIAVINGGFFTNEYAPVGLYLAEGKQVSRLSQAKLLSGIVGIDDKGRIRLLKKGGEFHSLFSAFQTGPTLIDDGRRVRVKTKGERARRSIIALDRQGNVFFIVTTSISLTDLTLILSRYSKVMGTKAFSQAMNLDGGGSTALGVVLPEHPLLILPSWKLRTMIVLSKK